MEGGGCFPERAFRRPWAPGGGDVQSQSQSSLRAPQPGGKGQAGCFLELLAESPLRWRPVLRRRLGIGDRGTLVSSGLRLGTSSPAVV